MTDYSQLPLAKATEIMVKLFSEVTGKPATPSTTWGRSVDKSKNPTIEKIAKDVYGGRIRFIHWHQDELQKRKELTLSSEMREIKEIFDGCFELLCERNQKYGDSWKVLNISSMANLVEMKLHRIANMGTIEPKVEDELMDSINYCAFALFKFYKSKQSGNTAL